MSILKSVRAGKYAYAPKTKGELSTIIRSEIAEKGNNCSLNHIWTGQIKDFSYLFSMEFRYFDGDISEWDTSNAEDMQCMFYISKFTGKNGGIGKWDVRNVKQMSRMFYASDFDADINDWKIGSATNMPYMFAYSKFNQNISSWNVSKVVSVISMFEGNTHFNQNLSNWEFNFGCLTSGIAGMFAGCNIQQEHKPWQLQKYNSIRPSLHDHYYTNMINNRKNEYFKDIQSRKIF